MSRRQEVSLDSECPKPSTAKRSSRNLLQARLASAGISRRRERSPPAPKITRTQGGAAGAPVWAQVKARGLAFTSIATLPFLPGSQIGLRLAPSRAAIASGTGWRLAITLESGLAAP